MHKQKLKTDRVEKNVAMHFMNIKTPKINIVNLKIRNNKEQSKEKKEALLFFCVTCLLIVASGIIISL